MKKTICIILLLLITSISLLAQTTYTWQGGVNGNWATPVNWSPNRNTPQSNDILLIQNSTTITNVLTQTVGKITISNSSAVNLQTPSALLALTVTDSLIIQPGSSVNIGSNGTALNVNVNGVVLVEGNITMTAGTFSVTGSGKMILNNSNPLAITSGSFSLAIGNTLQFGTDDTTAKIIIADNIFTSSPSISTIIVNNGNGASFGNQSITVSTDVQFTKGVLETNSTGRLIFSSSASSPSESITSYIDGYAETTKSVGIGSLNFLGLQLSSGVDDIGNVSLLRKTGTSGINTFNTNESISATWTITPQAQPTSGRNINFSWLSVHDNGQDPSLRFQVYKNEGSEWIPVGSLDFLSQQTPIRITQDVSTTTFSDWTVSNENDPLPVVWKNFYGITNESTIDLIWQTASEENADMFSIEKLTDEKEFVTIGDVQASGTSYVTHDYAFTDNYPLYGSNYYRIKQVDYDGKYLYSKIIEVRYNQENLTPYTVYPNPSSDVININRNFDFIKDERIIINDMAGKKIIETQWNNKRTFSINNIPTGIYLLTVYGVKGRHIEKIIIR